MGERKKEKKKGKKVPDQRKQKKYAERSLDRTISEQYRIVTKWTKRRKGNHDLKWSSPFNCQPKSCALATFRPALNKNRKGKEPKKNHHQKPKNPPKEPVSKGKSYWSMIMHVIFDLIGNNLQSQVMTYLWFEIRMKHLPVQDWYTLSDFLLFLLNPVFPLNGHLEAKC